MRSLRVVAVSVAIAAGGALAAPGAFAFDCQRASTKVENLICGSSELKGLDDQVGAAYAAAVAASPSADKPLLLETQKRWIAARENCGNWDAAEQTTCIRDSTAQRLSFLRPIGEAGVAGAMVPVLLVRKGAKDLYERNVELLKFANSSAPGQRAFNAEVDRILGSVPDKGEEFGDTPSLTYDARMEVLYVSPRFISAAIATDEYGGGAHGMHSTRFVNIDLESGQAPAFADIFSVQGVDSLVDNCRKQIAATKELHRQAGDTAAIELSEEEANSIKEAVRGLDRWSFEEQKAVVHFDPYSVGSYAEGSLTCTFDRAALQPYIRATAPIFK